MSQRHSLRNSLNSERPSGQTERPFGNPDRHMWLEGAALPTTLALDGFAFEPSKPHSYCNICGDYFQSELDRLSLPLPSEVYAAAELRRRWSVKHSGSHTSAEHRSYKASGLFMLPEAALRLIPFGIVPISDIVLDESNSSRQAASEAPRSPERS